MWMAASARPRLLQTRPVADLPAMVMNRRYALWLNGADVEDPWTGYANLMNWFLIAGGSLAGNGSGLSKGRWAGVVIVGVAVAAAAGGRWFWGRRRRRRVRRAAVMLSLGVTGSTDLIAVEKKRMRMRVVARGIEV